MASLLSAREANAAIEDNLLSRDIVHAEGVAQELVCSGSGYPSYPHQQYIHTRQFFDSHQFANNSLLFGQGGVHRQPL